MQCGQGIYTAESNEVMDMKTRHGGGMGGWAPWCAGLGWMLSLALRAAVLDAPVLVTNGWVRLTGDGQTNRVHRIERSLNLTTWSERATLHHASWGFTETDPGGTAAFYRVRSTSIMATDDGKNGLRLPDDPFINSPPDVSSPSPGVRWVKFLFRLSDPGRVWFQDSQRHLFHHDWGRLRLPEFAGTTRAQFDAMTLRREGRVAVAGAVVLPGSGQPAEFGIQLVGQDAFTREEVADWTARVRAAVQAPPGWRTFYVPTLEQSQVARDEKAWLSSRGVEVASLDRWTTADAAYSAGWAVGRMLFVPAGEIAQAYSAGLLGPGDILLTDAVPAEVPQVAGIVSLTPATPNSHVAILARTFEVPFGWSADAALRDRCMAWGKWPGREVVMRVSDNPARVELVALEGSVPEALRQEVARRKAPAVLKIQPGQRSGVLALDATSLAPADMAKVGGKAANFGLLRRTLPTNSPPAIALTFDLWDAFMGQRLSNGRTLRAELDARLGGLTYPPANMGDAQARLAGVRSLVRNEASFSPALRAEVIRLLQQSGLPVQRKLRFRSSTNVEDSQDFTGAGLYDSYSGCLPDELDGDDLGPCRCDAAERDERGVFRAIQRVYASFYNDLAFMERRRLGVDESAAFMGVLVHESYPDEDELANGVTTLNWTAGFGGSPSTDWRMVTQKGAESVSNPVPGARPEVVDGYRYGTDVALAVRETSDRMPLGATVLAWEAEYRALGSLFNRVADAYRTLSGGRTSYTLDFEFKKSALRGMEVKQVREIPVPKPPANQVPLLFGAPVRLTVVQGEWGDVFAMHRLKATWEFTSRNMVVATSNVVASVLRDAVVTRGEGAMAARWEGGPGGWPGATFARVADGTEDSFVMGDPAGTRWTLSLQLPWTVPGAVSPVLWLPDVFAVARADYLVSQPTFDFMGPTRTFKDEARLGVEVVVDAGSLLQERALKTSAGMSATLRFYWPEPPKGPSAGYTAPCIAWVGTTVTGLTREPLELRVASAQTYHPYHHNFSEEFLLEPALDPSVSAAQKAELADANIRWVYLFTEDRTTAQVWFVGRDGVLREKR